MTSLPLSFAAPEDNLLRRLLTRRRLLAYSRLCVIAWIGIWTAWLLLGDGLLDARGRPAGGDFLVYYSASDLALAGEPEAAYDIDRLHEVETDVLGADAGRFPWHYPPTFFLIIAGLSTLPYLVSLGLWLAVTGAALLFTIRTWLADRVVLWLTLAFPGLFQNAINGQTGFLSAAILGGGFLLLGSRPMLGGAVLGLITYKPHFAPLVFLALLAGRQKAALTGAVLSSSTLAALSFLVFGEAVWRTFIENIPFASNVLYDGALDWKKMTSVSAALLMLGLPEIAVQAIQALVSCAVAGLVVWVWRSDAATNLRYAALCFGILLATPYAFHYDLTILGLGLLFLGLECRATGWRAWEPELLSLVWLSPLLFGSLAAATGIGTMPVLLAAMLYVTCRRAQRLAAALQQAPEIGYKAA